MKRYKRQGIGIKITEFALGVAIIIYLEMKKYARNVAPRLTNMQCVAESVWGRNIIIHSTQSHPKKQHHKRIKLGICTRCGKREADAGYKTCGICRVKTRNYKRLKYGKPNRSERYKQGLCYFCDNPIKDGYKVCEKHYQMNVEKSNSSKAKDARKELIDNKILY